MKQRASSAWNGCPVRYAAGLFGDKWTLILLRDLLFKGRRYFGDFTDEDESIATNMLADRLKHLVDSGFVEKTQDVNNGKKFVYVLTQKGLDLLPVMIEIFKWSQTHDEATYLSAEFIEKIERSPAKYKRQILKEIKERDLEVLTKK